MPEPPQSTRPVVLVTGASGLIGSRVCARLNSSYTVVGLDIAPPEDESLVDSFIEVDLTEDTGVEKSLNQVKQQYGARIASVVHLAAYYDFSGEPSPLYEELTVNGTRRLLLELQQQQFDVEQFMFSSSLLVMKPTDEEDQHLTEFSETRAEWAYPESKLKAERAIELNHGSIPYVILRIAGVYDERCHSLPISQQIARIYENQLESHVFPGDPSHGQALIHLDDLTACIERAIQKRAELDPEEVFLIAEPDVMSYAEIQNEIGEALYGEEWTTVRVPKTVAKVGAYVINKVSSDEESFIKPWMIDIADDHYAVTIAHARSRLDWEPQHRLRETLPKMVEFVKSSPREFYEVNKLPLPEDLQEKK